MALAPGVMVMTAGGIYGTVRSISDDVVELEISQGVTIRVAKAAIGRVVDSPIVDAVEAPTMLPGVPDTGSDLNDEDRA